MFKLKKKHLIILGFLFIAFMLIGVNKVEATSVTVTTYDELKEAVNGHNDGITDTSITEGKILQFLLQLEWVYMLLMILHLI